MTYNLNSVRCAGGKPGMSVNLELLPLSFLAGMATFFNPCFGALLPAYVSLYFSQREANPSSWGIQGLRGLALGGVISAGFLTSLGGLGVIFALIGSAIGRYLPWVAVAVSPVMVLTGSLLLLYPSWSPSVGGVMGRWLSPKAKKEGSLHSFYLYGILYAICASACTLPVFLAVMTQTFLSGFLKGLLHFAAYGWGMSAMMLLFSVLLAFSKKAVYRVFHPLGHWVSRISGAFMIVAGGYVLYYLLIYGRYLDELLGR